jgi:hypothetical protein
MTEEQADLLLELVKAAAVADGSNRPLAVIVEFQAVQLERIANALERLAGIQKE